ncbi:MAG: IPT/TIG domain-containing protein [Solirubrobacterales bacterium]
MLFFAVAAVLVASALQVAIAAAAGEEHRYLPELSRSYSVDEADEEPCGIAFDSAGNRYVSAPEMFVVQVYDPSGEPITEFEPEGNFAEPCDLSVDASGAVYVDDIDGMVAKYVPTEPLEDGSEFELDGDAGDGGVIVEEGAFAIAVNPADQHLFAGEGSQISEYDADGGLVAELGDAVVGASWRGLDVYGTTGEVYSIDAQTNTAYVLDGADGSVQATITGAANPSFPSGFGNLSSADLAVDQANGDFYVNDTKGNEVVAEFSASGSFVSQIGPWLGDGEIKLDNLANFQAVAVDNGSTSPNKGDVLVPSLWAKPPLVLTLGLYAFAGELAPTPLPAAANVDPTGVTKTGATLKGSVDNEGAQSSSACKFVLALASAPSAPIAEPACSVDPVTGNTSKAVQAAVSGLTAGTEYVFSVVATNAGGPSTATPAKAFSTQAEMPAVTAVSPTKGPAAGGTTVTVTGTDLSGATTVNFGASNPATITANTATQITVTTPAGTPGAVDVTVTTAGGTSATSAADEFTYIAPLALAISKMGTGSGSVSCDDGPCAASYPFGTTVTLTATAVAGSSFGGWSGGGCTGTGPCVVTFEADTALTATFDAIPSPPDDPPAAGGTPPLVSPPPIEEGGQPKLPRSAEVSDGKAALLLTCKSPDPCAGKLRLTIQVKGKMVVLGEAPYRIAPGKSKTVRVKLSAAAKRRLASRGVLKVKARVSGQATTIKLELAA